MIARTKLDLFLLGIIMLGLDILYNLHIFNEVFIELFELVGKLLSGRDNRDLVQRQYSYKKV